MSFISLCPTVFLQVLQIVSNQIYNALKKIEKVTAVSAKIFKIVTLNLIFRFDNECIQVKDAGAAPDASQLLT